MREGFTKQRCPKCGGNMYLDKDFYGWYEQCLQCSYTSYFETVFDARKETKQGSDKRLRQISYGSQSVYKEVRALWKFNGCPRCERDIFIYQTAKGSRYEECFRCGYRAELDRSIETEEMLNEANPGQAE